MTTLGDSMVKFSYQSVPATPTTDNIMAIANKMGAQGWRWMRPPVKEDYGINENGTDIVVLFFEKAC
jgi:hypothetical protein